MLVSEVHGITHIHIRKRFVFSGLVRRLQLWLLQCYSFGFGFNCQKTQLNIYAIKVKLDICKLCATGNH